MGLLGFGPSRADRELMDAAHMFLHVMNYVIPKDGKLLTRPNSIVRSNPDSDLVYGIYLPAGNGERHVGSINRRSGRITYARAQPKARKH